MRKKLIAIASAIILGTATLTTGAMARGGHGGGGGGHFGGGAHFAGGGGHFGGYHGGYRGGHGYYGGGIGLGLGLGLGALYAFGGPGYYYPGYYYGGYGGCYQRRLVRTPYGLVYRNVYVCY